MPFLSVNGLEIDALVDGGFSVSNGDIRSIGLASDTTRQGSFIKEKFSVEFMSTYLPDDEAASLKDWISGRGHQWSFSVSYSSTATATLASDDGGLKFTGATTDSVSAKFGTHHMCVHPSGAGTATATFGASRNWSVALWHRPHGGSWDFYAVTYNGTGETYWTASGVTTSMFPFFTVTDSANHLVLSLQGENTAGSSATASYDSVRMLPYELTSDMIDALKNRTAELPAMPFVYLDGTFLTDFHTEVEAEGLVMTTTHHVVSLTPVGSQVAKQLKVSLFLR